MKKNVMKILVAALSLLMAIGIATGSTFAWFSLNSKVAVTGMHVTTAVKNNILIAEDTLGSTAKKADNLFKSNYAATTISALLEPTSTIDGETYFYNLTTNALGSGDAADDSYIAYAAGADFDNNYGVNETEGNDAVGYVDYVFQIKATNTSTSAPYDVRITSLDLIYNGAATSEKAFRVAVFVEDITSTDPTGSLTNAKLKTILAPSTAAYFTKADSYNIKNDTAGETASARWSYTADDATIYGNAATAAACTEWYDAATDGNEITSRVTVSGAASAKTANGANMAVNSTTALAAIDVNKYSAAAVIDTIAVSTTKYYKVVVRLWLEGEDTTCNNSTYADLTSDWALNLAIELTDSTDAVTVITKNGSAAPNVNLSAAVLAGSGDVVIDGHTYYKLNTQLGTTDLYIDSNTLSTSSRVYTISDVSGAKYLTDVTTQCIFAKATATSNTATVVTNQTTRPVTYQWKKSDNSDITGATSATFTNTGSELTGVYCAVTVGGNTYNSNAVDVAAGTP